MEMRGWGSHQTTCCGGIACNAHQGASLKLTMCVDTIDAHQSTFKSACVDRPIKVGGLTKMETRCASFQHLLISIFTLRRSMEVDNEKHGTKKNSNYCMTVVPPVYICCKNLYVGWLRRILKDVLLTI